MGQWRVVAGPELGVGRPVAADLAGEAVLLVVDGWCGEAEPSLDFETALVYDLDADVVVGTDAPPPSRHEFELTSLSDGTVVLTGGLDSDAFTLSTLRWRAGTPWAAGAQLSMPRLDGLSVPLNDGRLMLLGGFAPPLDALPGEQGLSPTLRVEIHHPGTGQSKQTSDLPSNAAEPAFAARLTTGHVLALPEVPSEADFASALYEPDDESWREIAGPMDFAQAIGLVALRDGGALAIDITGLVARYDSGVWRNAGRLMTARVQAAVAGLPDGRVFVAGGVQFETGVGQSSAELFDPATGTSFELASMPVPRFNDLATVLNDGSVLLAGGIEDRGTPPGPEPSPGLDGEEPPDPPCVPQSSPVLRWVP